jgi:hypothetical protein
MKGCNLEDNIFALYKLTTMQKRYLIGFLINSSFWSLRMKVLTEEAVCLKIQISQILKILFEMSIFF